MVCTIWLKLSQMTPLFWWTCCENLIPIKPLTSKWEHFQIPTTHRQQTRGGAFAQHVPCRPHTSWIRLPQTFSLTPRWPSYVQWFLRYPSFCLVLRQFILIIVCTLCFTCSCTCNISKLDPTVCISVLNPLLATSYWRRFTFISIGRTV
jgi:hypothetical protein